MSKKKEKEAFIEAYNKSFGNITSACKMVGISRQTYYDWRKNDEEFLRLTDDVFESLLDMAETMLLKKIREGATAELLFFLKTRGKSRGYVERQEHTGAEGGPLIWNEEKSYEKK